MLLGAQLILAVVCLAVVLPVSRAALPSGENVPRVCITDGCMRGLWMRSLHGERYEAFMGIPFAKPPVGELRFANPVPNDPWPERELDASGRIPRPACLQQNLFLPERGVEGQEDCLYLNVYRPEKIGNRSSTTSLPTLVYIHGGGFQAGYSSPLVLGAEKLMDNTVILVTIAYRVGAFGFLSTGDEAASGNFGLKDQRQALRWVHRNIAAFGGDPQLVTIMGHSAGGASVHLQLMHLGNEGLFQRAISLSGSALAPWCAPKPNPQQLARKQAQFLDIDEAHNMTTTELVEALRKVDADVFVRSYRQFLVDSEYSVLVYGPVVEAPTVVDAFLTESPKEQWARGAHLSVPWLTGFVPNDGFVFIAPTLKEADCSQETSASQKALLLNVLDGTKQKDLLPMVMERFFGNQSTYVECLTEDNVDKLTMIFNEALFLYPLMLSVRQHANHTGLKSPIYLYKFNYKGPYSYSSIFVPEQDESQDYGIVHCDELIYIFRAPILFPDFRRNSPDAKVTQVMTKLIVDFARTGTEPTGQSDSSQITAQADADIQKVSTDGDSKIAVDSAFPQVLELLNSNSTEQPVLKRYANFYDAEMFEFWTRFYSY